MQWRRRTSRCSCCFEILRCGVYPERSCRAPQNAPSLKTLFILPQALPGTTMISHRSLSLRAQALPGCDEGRFCDYYFFIIAFSAACCSPSTFFTEGCSWTAFHQAAILERPSLGALEP